LSNFFIETPQEAQMSVTSILNEVIQNIEASPNLIRIKKVMFCACKGKWENDHRKLHNISVETLVKELYWKTQTIDKLYKVFEKILSKINKKTEYSLVINAILEQISNLYLEVNEAQKDYTDILGSNNGIKLMGDIHHQTAQQSMINPDLRTLFEVRFKLMQHSNPLKVKILIFSAIEREFDFTSQDWLQLRSISLDQLLEQLVQTFPTLPALDSHLKKVSSYLDQSDEMLQVATVLIESIKPLYKTQAIKPQFSQDLENKNPIAVEMSHSNKNGNHEPVFQPIFPQDSRSYRAVYQSFKQSNLSEIETLHLMEVERYSSLKPFPDQNSQLSDAIDSDLISSCSGVSSEYDESSDQHHQELLAPLVQLEHEIEQQIHQSVTFAIAQMKTLLKDLEVEVESRLQDYPKEVQKATQHKTLKQFMRHFQDQIIEFDQTLSHPETMGGESQGDNKQDEISAESSTDSTHHSYNQNQTMELAKQGNSQAITTLINQSLNPRGINTVTKVRDGCLHVFLESEPVSMMESTAQFVHKKLIFLKIKSIQNIKIYGRKTGDKAIVWAQEFAYNHI
jgi:hypothetical protein